MNYAADDADPISPLFKKFLEDLGELARKHGIGGVTVATLRSEGIEVAAMGDDEYYPAALTLLEELRSAIYLRGPPAGNA